jgi:hypothetical protein
MVDRKGLEPFSARTPTSRPMLDLMSDTSPDCRWHGTHELGTTLVDGLFTSIVKDELAG